jgi:hypothetical protein
MKTFYYTRNQKEGHSGYIVTLEIYKIEKKIPYHLCSHTFNTASTRGEESEVFNGLAKNGFLPKKYQDKYAREIPHKAYRL